MSQPFITARLVNKPIADLACDDLLAGYNIKRITTKTSGQAGKMQEIDLQRSSNKEQITKIKAAVTDFFASLSKEDQDQVLQRLKKGERVVFKFRQSTRKTVPSSDWAIVSLVKDIFQPPKLAPGVCICVRTEDGGMVLDFKDTLPEAPGVFQEANEQRLKPVKPVQSKKAKKKKEIDPKIQPYLPAVAAGKSFSVNGDVLQVPPDGNCLFFALGIGAKMGAQVISEDSCLYRDEWTVQEFREEVVQWMRENHADHPGLQGAIAADRDIRRDRLEKEIQSLEQSLPLIEEDPLQVAQANELLAALRLERQELLANAPNIEEYLTRMVRDREWGGEPELYAVARMYGVKIIIRDAREDYPDPQPYEPENWDGVSQVTVRYTGDHYDVFIPNNL